MGLIAAVALLSLCLIGGMFFGNRNDDGPLPRQSLVHALLVVALVILTPVATWWSIGDRAYEGARHPDDLMFIARAPEFHGWISTALGTLALVAAIVCAALILRETCRGRLDRRLLGPIGMLVASGALVAAMGRVMTAGTIGANIGGGMAMLFGTPVVLAIIGSALFRYRRIRNS